MTVGTGVWPQERLDAIATRGSGHTPSKAHSRYWNGPVKWLSLRDTFRLDKGEVSETVSSITQEGLNNSSAVMHTKGSVVLLRDAGIGKSGVLDVDAAVSQHFMVWRCGPVLYNWYLYYVLQAMKPEFERISNGSTIKTIGLAYFKQMTIALPPRSEQIRVANALYDAGTLVRGLERMIAKKQAIKQGMMQQLLTGKTRVPGFTGQWAEIRLGSVGNCMRGVGYDPRSDLSSGDRPFTMRLLRSNNVQGGAIDCDDLQFVHQRRVSQQQVLVPGDIVMCMANGSRALVGKSALFDQPPSESRYTFGAFMGAFRTVRSRADPRYVAEMLGTKAFRNWLDVILAGSSINNLRPGDVEGFVTLMPGTHEQGAIADVLAITNREISTLRLRLAKAQAIKLGMMQELLTGRTRLPVAEGAV